MTDQDNPNDAGQTKRVIAADRFQGDTKIGEMDILAYTKHGPTSVISVSPDENLKAGEILKTKAWVLGARQLIVLGEHKKPMKIAGKWYEVRVVKAETKSKK